MANTKTGDKPSVAVGLEYESKGEQAPQVSVKADLHSAQELVKIAKRFGVPVRRNPELAQALHALELGAEIPESLFNAVAVVLHELQKPK